MHLKCIIILIIHIILLSLTPLFYVLYSHRFYSYHFLLFKVTWLSFVGVMEQYMELRMSWYDMPEMVLLIKPILVALVNSEDLASRILAIITSPLDPIIKLASPNREYMRVACCGAHWRGGEDSCVGGFYLLMPLSQPNRFHPFACMCNLGQMADGIHLTDHQIPLCEHQMAARLADAMRAYTVRERSVFKVH